MRKEKLNPPEQVNHMKSKGILFNIGGESEAVKFLENNTYYFKLKQNKTVRGFREPVPVSGSFFCYLPQP